MGALHLENNGSGYQTTPSQGNPIFGAKMPQVKSAEKNTGQTHCCATIVTAKRLVRHNGRSEQTPAHRDAGRSLVRYQLKKDMEVLTRSNRTAKTVTICLFCVLTSSAVCAQKFMEYFDKGDLALRYKKWDRAITFFTKALQEDPKSFIAYHKRALAYSKAGQYDKCVADLRKVIQIKPDYPEAYALMGLVYEIDGKYDLALRAYQEALKREDRIDAKRLLEKYIWDVKQKQNKKK